MNKNCRQVLIKEGKAYPKSGCEVCGPMSPKWKECQAQIEGGFKERRNIERRAFVGAFVAERVKAGT